MDITVGMTATGLVRRTWERTGLDLTTMGNNSMTATGMATAAISTMTIAGIATEETATMIGIATITTTTIATRLV